MNDLQLTEKKLLVLVVLFWVVGGSYIVDFEKFVKQYVEHIGEHYGQKLFQFKPEERQKFTHRFSKYRNYNVTARISPLKYNKPTSSVHRATYVYTHWFHNPRDIKISSGLVQKNVVCYGLYTWVVERGMKIENQAMMIRTMTSKEFDNIADFLLQLSSENPQTTSQAMRMSFSMHKYNIEPLSSVKVEMHIPIMVTEVPWETEINIDGWIVLDLPRRLQGSRQWSFPVWWLANDEVKASGKGNSLVFHAYGTLHGVSYPAMVEKNVVEMPLQPHHENSFEIRKTGRLNSDKVDPGLCELIN